jgi:hypothetical protein
MSNYRVSLTSIIAITIGLSACQQSSSPADRGDHASKETTSQISNQIFVEPATLSSCGVGKIVTVKWDVRAEKPAITDVEIFTGAPMKETLFAAGGPTGEAATGPWASPGTVFILKNKADGKNVAHIVVGGPTCQ